MIAATLPLAAMLSVRLAALFYTARHPADAMLRLRATQAALFRDGILLHHEPRSSHELPDPGLGSRLAADSAPDLITEALEYKLVHYETDPETGATELGLHPDVKFSLGITEFRYPPEDDAGASTTEDP